MSSEFGKFEIFQSVAGAPEVAVRFEGDDVWLTQKHIALLYGTTKQNVGQHVKSILDSGELMAGATVKKFFTMDENAGQVAKVPIYHYNLDMIIADNDAPGLAGARALSQELGSARIITPPEGCKDLREWCVDNCAQGLISSRTEL